MKGEGTSKKRSDRVDLGWSELRDGRWSLARLQFEQALSLEETAEAFEGLSWAAWWLDDAETVFAARERAFHLYQKAGNPASAALMATWLAADQVDFNGAVAVANGWMRRAYRLLEPLEPGPAHGWLAFHDGFLAFANGDVEKGEALAVKAADLGRQCAIVDLEMLGLALEGATLVARARIEEGMARLDEATAIALDREAAIPISGAWTCCLLVTSCAAAFDYDRAVAWCDRIAEFADRFGSRYMLAFCRAEYGAVHLWRGRWAEAEALLEASYDDFSLSRPAWTGGPLAALAELRRRQGRFAEAIALLDQAGGEGSGLVCRGRIWLERGEALQAADAAERVLRQLPPSIKLDRVRSLELLIHARIATGRLEEARTALAALRELGALVGTAPIRASCDLAEGMLAAASGDFERARTLLEDAVDRYARCGAPFETAVARVELAATLLALGRRDSAKQEASEALRSFKELGALSGVDRSRRLLRACEGTGEGHTAVAQLTVREREVLRLLAGGLTNRQIAANLSVSEHTVHRHVTNILRKLDLPSRTAAATHAVQAGMHEVSTP